MSLPERIKKLHTCVYVKTKDSQSYKWAVLSALHPSIKNPNRISHYTRYENELNFDGIDFPVIPKDIPQFEIVNDISINVYGWTDGSDKNLLLVHKTLTKKPTHIDLFLIAEIFHYAWIKDLPCLLKYFTVVPDRFLENNEVAQSENKLEILDDVRDTIFQRAKKLKTTE